METINLCLCSDNNYAQHLGVTLLSFAEHHKNHNISCFILDGGISQKNKHKILSLQKIFQNINIKFIEINENAFSSYEMPKNSHFSSAIFYRFKIPELFSDLDKILYMDVDIVVLNSIIDFYKTDLTGYCFGMVPDWSEKQCAESVGTNHYYNSGVMLFNIKECLKKDVTSTLIETLSSFADKSKYPDQDMINSIFEKSIKRFDFKFNAQNHPSISASTEYIKNNINNISILHYTSKQKPWKNKIVPFEKLYIENLKKTPWKNNIWKIKASKIPNYIFRYTKLDLTKTFYFLGLEIFRKEYKERHHPISIILFKAVKINL